MQGGPIRTPPSLAVPVALLLGCSACAELVPSPPTIEAAAAILVGAQSGAVLYEKSAFEKRPPASLTKMVTALVVAERCEFDEVATVSSRAAGAEGSGLGLRTGEKITVGITAQGIGHVDGF